MTKQIGVPDTIHDMLKTRKLTKEESFGSVIRRACEALDAKKILEEEVKSLKTQISGANKDG